MEYKEFYAELGKLVYALVKANGKVSLKEEKLLHKMVIEELVPNEAHMDEFGTDAAYYVEMEFEFLKENFADPMDSFNSFIDYVTDHHTAMNEYLTNITINLATRISEGYYGINRYEKEMLIKLKDKLNKIEYQA